MSAARQLRVLFAVFAAVAAPSWAQDTTGTVSVEDMQRLVMQLNAALEERDALILDLAARVEALEKALSAREPQAAQSAVDTRLDAATVSAEEELDDVDRLAQTALERTLIQAGGLLLPRGTIEFEPAFAYGMTATDTVDIDCLLIADILCIGDINSKQYRRETYSADLTFRAGLPWDMQFDLRMPFIHATTTAVFGDGASERAHSTELGDIEIALSRQLLREKGWRPDLLAELRWKGRSGNDPFDLGEDEVATGTGFDDLRLGLTMVKVRDPLVLFSNVSYTHTSSDTKPDIGRIEPGATVAAQLGVAVALNLETSLNFGWTQSWMQNTRIDGEKIVGSNRRPGVLNIGATYVPAAGRSVNFNVDFGLTDDAPDVNARFSMPMRTN